jgi:predicted MFS family arabinose efflux permease
MRSPLVLVTAGVFLYFTSWKLMTPLLPLWAGRLGATPLAVGGLLTGYAAADLACTPVLGALSDRFGRKPVIVVSLGLSAACFTMTALARSFAVLLAAQIVGGLGAAIVSAAYAMVADRVHPGGLAHALAYLLAAIGVANAVGPALAAALSTLGPTVPFWAAAALACGTTVMMGATLPETRRRGSAVDNVSAAVRWRDLLRSSWIHRLAVTALIFGCVIVTLETVLVLFTQRALGWAEVPNGWLFAYFGVVVVVMQLGVVGRCVVWFGERRLLLGGLAVAALGLALLGISTTAAPVVIGVGVIGIGVGLIAPLLPTLFCFASPAENRGAVLGFMQALVALARLISPLMAGAAFTWSIGAPFIIVGLLCLIGVCLLAVGSKPAIDAGGAGGFQLR